MININLLPEDIREDISYSKKNLKVLKYIRIILVLCILLLSSFVLLYVFLLSNNKFFLGNIKESEGSLAKYQDVFTDAQKLQGRINSIEKIKKDYNYWSKLNYIFSKTVPEGIYLTSVEFEDKSMTTVGNGNKGTPTKNNKIIVNGRAKTKEDIGVFRDGLSSQSGFEMVNIESVKEDDQATSSAKNSFILSFILKDDVLKKGKK